MSLSNYKIICISDLHGQFPIIKEKFDLMLIAGDIIDLYLQRYTESTKKWYKIDFCSWINTLPFKNSDSKVLWIAGNHEVGFELLGKDNRKLLGQTIQESTGGRAIYLEDESYNFNGITIYGTPWCKIFGNWAFMKNDEALKRVYSEIPNNVDILLTHDAPYGTSDLCFGWQKCGRTPYHIGNEPLRDAIVEKSPKYNIHGHLHSSNHDCEILNKTKVYNVSLVDEEYELNYKPLILKW